MGRPAKPRAPVADRVRGFALLPPERVEESAGNWRTHGAEQRGAMAALFGQVGSVAGLVVWVPDDVERERLRAMPGSDGFEAWLAGFAGKVRLLDGHMRKGLLGRRPIRVQVTDLDAREAALVLATFDPVGQQAGRDEALLRELLGAVGRTDTDADRILDDLRRALGETKPTAPAPDQTERTQAGYVILVECASEEEQLARIEELLGKGWPCRALT